MDISPYQSALDSLNLGFVVCLVFAVLFLIVSVALFFLFDVLTMLRRRLGIEAREIIEDFKEKNESIGEVGERGERGETESRNVMPWERTSRRGLKMQGASVTVGLFGVKPSEDALPTVSLARTSAPQPTRAICASEDALPTVSLASESVLASKTTVLPKSPVRVEMRAGSSPSPSPSTQEPFPSPENLGAEGFAVTRDVMLIDASEDALIR